ncbi:MAG: filamentous hemagglutinin N-terminal domain-containing protein, partial [Phycisphaerae bacterium]|nr:filamentous hemagglutinin N-terminal domain-containing protein [Phycisphaerae bacterium]
MLRPKRRFLRPHPRLLFRAAGSAFSILGVIIAARPAAAQVTGEQVVSGQAAFHRNGANTTITAANNTVINYQQFSIAPGATVRFIQPDSASRVLNRVTGPDPSTIAGSLIANGIVYIVNPAGVYFRQGALVDVAGIYAAAGHIADADFLSGVNRFTDVGGRVVNQGAIHAHTAALIGSVVSNEGVIESPGGVVTLVAGDEVLLGERGSAIYVRMNPPSGPEEADPASGHAGADGGPAPMPGSPRVSNSGTINARTG